MKLCNLDEVVKLRNYRANVAKLRSVAESGYMELKFTAEPHPESHISLECVRRAVAQECDRELADYEARLKALGVEV